MENLSPTSSRDTWLKMLIFSVKTTSRVRRMEEGKATLSFYPKSHIQVGRNGGSSLIFVRMLCCLGSQDFSPEVSKAGQSWGKTGMWVHQTQSPQVSHHASGVLGTAGGHGMGTGVIPALGRWAAAHLP